MTLQAASFTAALHSTPASAATAAAAAAGSKACPPATAPAGCLSDLSAGGADTDDAANPKKRSAPPAAGAGAAASTVQYANYQEYYEQKYGFRGLSSTTPLMQVKGFSLHSSAVNYLMPPRQCTRHREMRRMAQHRSIAKTLYKVNQDDSHRHEKSAAMVGEAQAAAGAAGKAGEGSAAGPSPPEGDLSVLSWHGPKLVPELCSVHPLPLSVWRALQFIPSLMYRMEGLLVAHELRERLRPRWLSRAAAPSTNKMLEAITHRSCADSIDFERYELLGDAFLKFATANHLYTSSEAALDEGGMSLELHRRVSNGTLWRCSVMTRWLGMSGQRLTEGWQSRLRGVAESLRLSPFRLNYWAPPGLLDLVKPPRRDVLGKVVSDAMEAIIGVFYEALGPARTNCWLACLGLLPGGPTDPAEWERSAGVDTLATLISNDLQRNRQVSGQVGVAVNDGEVTETYLPQTAFEAASAMPEPPASQHPQHSTERLSLAELAAREQAGRQALDEIEQSLESMRRFTDLPTPQLDTNDEFVCCLVSSLVGTRRLKEACYSLPALSVADLPPAQPLDATPAFHALVGPHLFGESVPAVLRFLKSARRLAAQGTAARVLGASRSAVQQREEQACVSLEAVLGYKFTDPLLERTARVHPSWMHQEEDYGRLEFLGDAVLGLIVTSYIFYCLGADSEKNLKPGQLSDLRSSIVKNDCLAFLACMRGLDRCLLHSCPTLHDSMTAFSSVVRQKLSMKHQVAAGMSTILFIITGCGMGYMGSMEHPKALGDVVESAIGAVYLDSGMSLARTYPVVMGLLDNLQGVSPTTYPQHPVNILSRITVKFGLAPVRFSMDEETHTAGSRFRGRARIRNVWLSSICTGTNRFSVRTKCAEEVLLQLRHDADWLLQIHLNEDGRFSVQDLDRWARQVPDAAVQADAGGISASAGAAAQAAPQAEAAIRQEGAAPAGEQAVVQDVQASSVPDGGQQGGVAGHRAMALTAGKALDRIGEIAQMQQVTDTAPVAEAAGLHQGAKPAGDAVPQAVHIKLDPLPQRVGTPTCEGSVSANEVQHAGCAVAKSGGRSGRSSCEDGRGGTPSEAKAEGQYQAHGGFREAGGAGVAACRQKRASGVPDAAGVKKMRMTDPAAATETARKAPQHLGALPGAHATDGTTAGTNTGGLLPLLLHRAATGSGEVCMVGGTLANAATAAIAAATTSGNESAEDKVANAEVSPGDSAASCQERMDLPCELPEDATAGRHGRAVSEHAAAQLPGAMALHDNEEVILGAAVGDCKRHQPGKRRAAPGLMTLQELQLIKDTVLDADMVKNEAEREARMAARRQSALVSKQVDRAENAQKHEAQKPTREVQHKPRASIMHAAGTGNVQNVLPAKELLDWINRGESFLPPALAGQVLAKEGKLSGATEDMRHINSGKCGSVVAADEEEDLEAARAATELRGRAQAHAKAGCWLAAAEREQMMRARAHDLLDDEKCEKPS